MIRQADLSQGLRPAVVGRWRPVRSPLQATASLSPLGRPGKTLETGGCVRVLFGCLRIKLGACRSRHADQPKQSPGRKDPGDDKLLVLKSSGANQSDLALPGICHCRACLLSRCSAKHPPDSREIRLLSLDGFSRPWRWLPGGCLDTTRMF